MAENRIEIIKIEHFVSDLSRLYGSALQKCMLRRSAMLAAHLL